MIRGFSQWYEIDYKEIFALTLHFDSLCMLLTIAAHKDLHIHQMNVVSAYLADELKDEIYMKPLKDLSYIKDRLKRMVCCLIKSLYSLKQSERVWNNTFQVTLKSFKFMRLSEDNSVFLNWVSEVIIALYIDDLLIFVKKLRALLNIKKKLKKV